MSGPISPLSDYIRISREIASESPRKIIVGFPPIRLGKRHAAFLTNSRNYRPYFWEYKKDEKRAFTPYKFSNGGTNILVVPFNRGKRDPTLRNLSDKPLLDSQMQSLNPKYWDDVIDTMYDNYNTLLAEENDQSSHITERTNTQEINIEVRKR